MDPKQALNSLWGLSHAGFLHYDSERPAIELNGLDPLELSRKTRNVIVKNNQPPKYFQRADVMARLVNDPDGSVTVDVLDKKKLRFELYRSIQFTIT